MMSKGDRAQQKYELIYETLHGSRAYGLDRAGSDLDYKGVIVGPEDWYFGYAPAPTQAHQDAPALVIGAATAGTKTSRFRTAGETVAR